MIFNGLRVARKSRRPESGCLSVFNLDRSLINEGTGKSSAVDKVCQ